MIEISPKVSATLTLCRDRGFRFFDLPPVIGQLLTKVGIHVFRVDLAFDGNSARYETDQGTVSVTHAVDARGTERLVILCDTLRRGSREVGRQNLLRTRAAIDRGLPRRHDILARDAPDAPARGIPLGGTRRSAAAVHLSYPRDRPLECGADDCLT